MKMSQTTNEAKTVPIKKVDDEQQLVFGEVYAPNIPDSQGDWMTAETIRNMAYGFMKSGRVFKIDINHSQEESGCYVVESFLAREGDDTFIPGSWVVGVHIPSGETWSLVKSGELNGFSLDGFGIRVATELEIEMPELLKGETEEHEGEKHTFVVQYDDEGNFLGGYTSKGKDGHYHEITKGTVTEKAGNPPHSHRFAHLDGLLYAKIEGELQ